MRNECNFAEWLAENHWRAHDIITIEMHKRTCYWVSESEPELGRQTTEQLYKIFNAN